MKQVMISTWDFITTWALPISAVGMLLLGFVVGRVSKKQVIKETVVIQKPTRAESGLKGRVDAILAPVIEKGL